MKKTFPILLVLIAIGAFIYFGQSNKNAETVDNAARVEYAVQNVKAGDAKAQIESTPGIVIDVRTKEEYDNGHLAIADAQYDFLSGEFAEKVDELDKSKAYYLYCQSGNRSGKAADILIEKGFKHVYNIGGFPTLEKAGFETEKE